ncbi:MAG: hypothetical protein PHH13_03915 [Candidatus Peribacteraceae bacterium]|nr:hypothetical protein [Candidatus Peribacteraceae bacterium]
MWFLAAMAGNVLWVASDVTNSVLVHRFESRPFILAWVQSAFDLFWLCMLVGFVSFHTVWFPWYAAAGLCSYVASLVFLAVLKRFDVSIMHAAWVFQALAVSIAGFVIFQERWTFLQSVGAILALSSVLFVAFWHKHITLFRTVAWLLLLGLLYTPFFIVQKAAVEGGETIMTAFFWTEFFQKGTAQVLPWVVPGVRRSARGVWSRLRWDTFFLNVFASLCIMLGCLSFVAAFKYGPVSLVAVLENSQPFLAIIFAWLLCYVAPTYAPRELLTKQSVSVKVVSFTLVAAGMVCMAVS